MTPIVTLVHTVLTTLWFFVSQFHSCIWTSFQWAFGGNKNLTTFFFGTRPLSAKKKKENLFFCLVRIIITSCFRRFWGRKTGPHSKAQRTIFWGRNTFVWIRSKLLLGLCWFHSVRKTLAKENYWYFLMLWYQGIECNNFCLPLAKTVLVKPFQKPRTAGNPKN